MRRVTVPALTCMLALPLFARLGVCVGELGLVGVVAVLVGASALALLLLPSLAVLLARPPAPIPTLVRSAIGGSDALAVAVAALTFHVLAAACVVHGMCGV